MTREFWLWFAWLLVSIGAYGNGHYWLYGFACFNFGVRFDRWLKEVPA